MSLVKFSEKGSDFWAYEGDACKEEQGSQKRRGIKEIVRVLLRDTYYNLGRLELLKVSTESNQQSEQRRETIE